jgi:predicted secreted protein
MKKLIFLAACLVALTSQPVLAQTVGTDVVVVRVAEAVGRTHLTIERSGQEPEEISFDWADKTSKNQRASKGYLDALNKLYQQGYQVQATIPGAQYANGGTAFTTLVFTKPSR